MECHSNPDCTNPCELPRQLIRIKPGVAWSLPSVQVLGRSRFQVWLCVFNAFACLTQESWLKSVPGSCFWMGSCCRRSLDAQKLHSIWSCCSDWEPNSALATSLLDLALICSIILRKLCDLFLMPSYFEKYHFPVPCARKRVMIEEQMSDLLPACMESRERGNAYPKA